MVERPLAVGIKCYNIAKKIRIEVMPRFLCALLPWLFASSLLAAEAPLRVFVSVLPQQTFVERIGGDHVAVAVMVQPGRSPATYDPTPGQMEALADADLYVRIGVPFEDAWMDRVRAMNPQMPVLDNRDGIALRVLEAHTHAEDDHHHGHGHGPVLDAHVWTAPRLVAGMAAGIRDELARLRPAAAAAFQANYEAFAGELEALDDDIRAQLAEVRSRRFLVFHPAWGYFADAYGLEQVAIEAAGKEPGARALAAVIDQAKREGIGVVFVQPQFNRRAAERVAEAIGGRVIPIDPLSPNYFVNLRAVSAAIAAADRERSSSDSREVKP
jgi:zinc transport system substrate-binding protein